jgi:hypothetical protein
MATAIIRREDFIGDRLGRTFADVVNDPELPFDQVLEFFSAEERQRRMEESEIHHDRPALAGVVRELEAQPAIERFLASPKHPHQTKRLRQAVGVVVRMIMERRGWRKTGKKGSLGVRTSLAAHATTPGVYHNTGGLAFWFLRAERYEREGGMPFQSVRERCEARASRFLHESPSAAMPVASVDREPTRSA